jgi:hypothetical protein
MFSNQIYPKPEADQQRWCRRCEMVTPHRVERYPVTRLYVCQKCGRFFVVTVSEGDDDQEKPDPAHAFAVRRPTPPAPFSFSALAQK